MFTNNGNLNNGLASLFPFLANTDIDELNKALSAGYAISSQTGGGALRMESLDRTLRVTTAREADLAFWHKINKGPAGSTVEQYNKLSSYGGSHGAFISETGTPVSSDSTLARAYAYIKYLATLRQVSVVQTLVNTPHEDAVALETRAGAMWMLEKLNGYLYTADDTLYYSGATPTYDRALSFPGLDAQIDSTMYIDLEGRPIQEADVEEAAVKVVQDGYGHPSDMFWSNITNSDYMKTVFPRERINIPVTSEGGMGYIATHQLTTGGRIWFNPDRYVLNTPNPPSAETSTKAPAAPDSVTPAVGGASTDGDFNKGTGTGPDRYYYRVTACNFYGESASVVSGALDIIQAQKDANNHVDLTIAKAAVYGTTDENVEWFNIYRTEALSASASAPSSLTSYYKIGSFAATDRAAPSSNAPDDVNLILPNTYMAYIGENNKLVLEFRQLLTLMKIDMPMSGLLYQFMIVLFGVPILFQEKKWCRLINIKALTRS